MTASIDDDVGFDNYEPITVDPGPWLFIGVCAYSVLCVVLLPFIVKCGNRREKRRLDRKEWGRIEMSINSDDETKEESAHIGAIEAEFVDKKGKNKRECSGTTVIKTVSSKKINAGVNANGLSNGSRVRTKYLCGDN